MAALTRCKLVSQISNSHSLNSDAFDSRCQLFSCEENNVDRVYPGKDSLAQWPELVI